MFNIFLWAFISSLPGLSGRLLRAKKKKKKKKKAILQSRSKSCERRSWLVTRGPPLLQVSDYTSSGIVVKFLSSSSSHEIWKDSNKKIRWFKNLIICFIYHAYNDVIFLVSLICFSVFTWRAPLKNVHINENIKNKADFAYGIMQKLKTHPALRAELPCFSFLIDKEEKGIYLNRVNLLNPDFWTSQSCFLSSNWFFDCKSVCLLINRWS